MAGAGSIDVIHDAQCAEMVAWMMALEAASVNGMMRIIIETDCSCLVSALKSTAFDQAPAGFWFMDTRIFMSLNFIFADVVFVPRDCNWCAHEMAHQYLYRDLGEHVWFDPLSNFVTALALRGVMDQW